MRALTLINCVAVLMAGALLADDIKKEEKPLVEFTIDTTDGPEVKEFADRAQKVAEEWYPIIVKMLPSEGFKPADKITIVFSKSYKGVAAASGTRIICSVKYFFEHPGDVGAIVHEITHVVQAYHSRVPIWLIEGIADHVRWFNYEPERKRPHPRFENAKYDASYQTSAAFLDWACRTYDKDLVVKLNAACRDGKYDASLWEQLTARNVEELGWQWKDSLRPPDKISPREQPSEKPGDKPTASKNTEKMP